MAGLEVQIGADITDFEKKIKEVEHDIKDLSKVKLDQIKLGLDTKEIDANIKDAKKSLSDLKSSLKDSGASFDAMKPKVANGGNALMQFSRIAQDAPFGIMGIGNNITATAEAFGHLSKESGGAGGALKAVASSMMGTGGILLAVSLVTTGLTIMSQQGLTVSDVFEKLSGTFDETANEMKKIGQEAAKNAGSEISEMKAYVSVAANENLKRNERIAAVKKLQDMYPAYFGNLSQEQILTGNVADAVNGVTVALRNKALAQAYAGKAGELASKEVELRDKEADLIQKSKDALKEYQRVKKEGDSSFLINELESAKQNFNAYQAQLKDVQKEIKSTIADIDRYQKKQNEFSAKSASLDIEAPKKVKTPKAKKAKEAKKDTHDYQKDIDRLKEIAFQMQQVTSVPLFEIDEKTESNLNRLKEIALEMSYVVDTETRRIQGIMESFSKSANDLVKGAISETFMSLGEMIGNSMTGAEGGLADAGKVILGVLGNFMTQYGQLMIETGVGLIVADNMIKSGNGYAMIAGGVVLAAVGAAFASKSKEAKSGGATSKGGGSVNTGASYSSPVSSGGGGSSFGGGTVVFEIAGTSLIGVLNNTLDKNKRLGGNLPIG